MVDQVELVERVARALCFEDGPNGCDCVGQCKSDPFPSDDIFMRFARAAIKAIETSSTPTIPERSDGDRG